MAASRTYLTRFDSQDRITSRIGTGALPSGVTFDATIVQAGVRSLKFIVASGSSASQVAMDFTAGNDWRRFNIRFAAFPSTARAIMGNASGTHLKISPSGTIDWYSSSTLIQAGSTALSLDTWYCLEVRSSNVVGSQVKVRINGATDNTNANNAQMSALLGCADTVAATFTMYIDDAAVDSADWPGVGRVGLAKPISDNARATLWVAGSGATTSTSNLWEGVNNWPPTGTATPLPTANGISHTGGAAGSTDDYDANMTTYSSLGIGAGDTVNAVQARAMIGEDIATGTKLLTMSVKSNPAQGAFQANQDVGAAAVSTYPTNWNILLGTVINNPTVTIASSPVMTMRRPETASRAADVCFMGLYVDYTPVSGTTYTQTVSGGFTPAGTSTPRDNKVVAGGFTPAGAIVRKAAKTPSGSITPAGALAKRTAKTPSGAFTPSGTLAGTKVSLTTVSGAFTPTGALVRRDNKTVAGTFTPAGALVRLDNKVLSGAFTPSGTLSPRIALKSFTGSITPTGALTGSKVALQTISGGFTPAGALVRRGGHILVGAIIPAGALTRRDLKVLAGAFTPSGALSTRINAKVLSGSITPAGALTAISVRLVTVSGAFTPAGALVRRAGHIVSGALTPAGALTRNDLKVLAGTLSSSGALVRRDGKVLSGSVTPSGTVTGLSLLAKALSGSIAPAGAILKRSGHILAGALTPAGALTKRDNKALAGAFTPAGTLAGTKVALTTVSGTLATSGALTRREAKVLTGVLATAGALSRIEARVLLGALGLAGAVTRRTSVTETGTLAPAGALSTTSVFGALVGGVLAPTGELVRGVAHSLFAALTFIGDLDRFTGDVIVLVDVDAPVLEGMRWVMAVAEGYRWDVPVVEGFRYTVPVLDD